MQEFTHQGRVETQSCHFTVQRTLHIVIATAQRIHSLSPADAAAVDERLNGRLTAAGPWTGPLDWQRGRITLFQQQRGSKLCLLRRARGRIQVVKMQQVGQ
eukprot:365542-Chlamydomonas_euryale.AAC.24